MFQVKYFTILLVVIAVFATTPLVFAADTFPVNIYGQTIELGLETTYESVESGLSAILPNDARSVFNDERIQYDFIAAEDRGTMTIALDFDSNRKLVAAFFDAFSKEDNPVARDLVQWLKDNVGQGEKKEDGLVWIHAGMSLYFNDMPDVGEDSMYGLFMKKGGYVKQ